MNSESIQTSDGALLERLRAGDQAAFDELFRRYRSLVLGICHRELGNRELAEDAASAVFLVLHRRAPSLRPDHSISSWLFTVSMLCVKNAKRTEKRTMNLHSKLEPPENRSTHDTHANQALRQALMGLRDAERHAIELYYLEQLPISEISDRLGIKEGACRMRLRRSLEALRRKLGPEGFAAIPGALGARSVSDLAGTATASPAAMGMAVHLTRALAAQTALRAAALCVFALGVGSIGVGLARATLGNRMSTPANRSALTQSAQSAPPSLPPGPPMPDGPLAAGAQFRISYYLDGQLVGRKNTTIGKDGFALATLDLSPWPGLKRAAANSKTLDASWRKDLKKLGDDRSQGVLKFSVSYVAAKNGKPRQTLFDGSFLGPFPMKILNYVEGEVDLLYTDFVMMVNPADGKGSMLVSTVGPHWEQKQGGPWVLATGDQREQDITYQLAGMQKSLESTGAQGHCLGIDIENVATVNPP